MDSRYTSLHKMNAVKWTATLLLFATLAYLSRQSIRDFMASSPPNSSLRTSQTATPGPDGGGDSRQLTRLDALTILMAKGMGEHVERFEGLAYLDLVDLDGPIVLHDDAKFALKAIEAGLLSGKKAEPPRGGAQLFFTSVSLTQPKFDMTKGCPYDRADLVVDLTPEGRRFHRSSDEKYDFIALATLSPKKVTGITAPTTHAGKITCTVHFEYMFYPTPFGKAYDLAVGKNYSSGRADGVATFVLYDDGWRLEKWQSEESTRPVKGW